MILFFKLGTDVNLKITSQVYVIRFKRYLINIVLVLMKSY